MSDIKNLIALKAVDIRFTEFSIIYDIVIEGGDFLSDSIYSITCPNDIAEKELILKPTFISKNKMEVIYTPSNMTPHYFQHLLLKKIRNYEEHSVDIANYYVIGDIVGYILVSPKN